MRFLCLPLVLAAALAAPDKPDVKKPDPVKKAREMLDAAAEMLGGVQPQIQVVGLWHLAENYQAFDRKKALEFYKQAWAGTPTLAPEQVERFEKRLQVDIIRSVADVDAGLAIEMVKQMKPAKGNFYDNRLWAIVKIVEVLGRKSEFDKAIEFLDAMGGLGAYSFRAASALYGRLPPGDPRRTFLFASAQAVFGLRPARDFGDLLADHAADLPPQTAAAAVSGYVKFILDSKNEPVTTETGAIAYQTRTYATAKGTASFNTSQEADLFDVMWLVERFDPKRAEELLAQYPNLKASLAAYPKGTKSMQTEGLLYTYSTLSSTNDMDAQRFAQQFRMRAIVESRKFEVLQAAVKDPDKAIELVKSIPQPAKQAEILSAVARDVAEKDPAKSRNILNKCMAALPEVKDPGERIPVWDAVAESAALIKDDKLLWEALERGLSDAGALYRWDTEDAGGNPRVNVQLQEYWPSTVAYRRIVMRAASILKTDAEPLLHKIADPNLNLLARIAMAQALLGRMVTNWPVYSPKRTRRA